MSAIEDKKRSYEDSNGNGYHNSGSKRRPSIIVKSSNKIGEDGLSKCFHRVRTRLYLSLAPCYLSHPLEGIKQQHLDPMVMTYYQEAKGVVLAYFNLELSSDNQVTDEGTGEQRILAKVSASNPFAFLWCTVDFLVWKPQIGDVVEGWSYMQSQSHIGLLINDTFNATIKKYNIPSSWRFIPNQADEFRYDEETTGEVNGEDSESKPKLFNKSLGQWVDENEVAIEGKLKFTIKALHTAGKVVSIEGTLLKPGFEKESLPVVRDSTKHKKFDDNEYDESAIILEEEEAKANANADDKDELPAYTKDDSSSEDDKVVGGDLSSSEEEDSD